MIMSDKRTYVIQTCLEILLAAAVVESGDAPSVREALLKLTSGDKASTPIYPWTASGMRDAFQAVRDKDYGRITGVSGPLEFESQTHICQLATHTTASHAGLYNDACYGNVYRNTPEEFLKPR